MCESVCVCVCGEQSMISMAVPAMIFMAWCTINGFQDGLISMKADLETDQTYESVLSTFGHQGHVPEQAQDCSTWCGWGSATAEDANETRMGEKEQNQARRMS